jgi:hypothetical protein
MDLDKDFYEIQYAYDGVSKYFASKNYPLEVKISKEYLFDAKESLFQISERVTWYARCGRTMLIEELRGIHPSKIDDKSDMFNLILLKYLKL